jgi:hypothetical protein
VSLSYSMEARDFIRRWVAVGVVLVLAGGCAAEVARRPAAPTEPAVAVVDDVEIAVGGVPWRGWPADLGRIVTPVHVLVVNRGTAPVRVAHEEFALVGADGQRFGAILPTEVRGVVYDPPPAAMPSAGFAPGADVIGDWVFRGQATPSEVDPGRVGEQFGLPSKDVLERALPEGVVEPSAAASGFVYFERRAGAHAGPVELSARLLDARTGEPLVRAVIPVP